VVLIHHAVTDPGVGDPPGFKLDDCTTQLKAAVAPLQSAGVLFVLTPPRSLDHVVDRGEKSRWNG